MNYSQSIDLKKLPGARFVKFQGENGLTETYACIPVNAGYIVKGEKGCYMNLIQQEMKEQRYGQSHFIKPSYSKAAYDEMTEDQRKQIPIIGSSKEIQSQKNTVEETAEIVKPVESEDGLPF